MVHKIYLGGTLDIARWLYRRWLGEDNLSMARLVRNLYTKFCYMLAIRVGKGRVVEVNKPGLSNFCRFS